MAWSPQARAAALAARKRKGHRTSKTHLNAPYTPKRGVMKHSVTARQAGSHSQFKRKVKTVAKYTAVAGAAGAVAYGTYKSGVPQKQVKKQISKKVRRDARARIAQKGPQIDTIKANRIIQTRYKGTKTNNLTAKMSQNQTDVARATIRQINRYSKRTPYKRPGSKKTRYR